MSHQIDLAFTYLEVERERTRAYNEAEAAVFSAIVAHPGDITNAETLANAGSRLYADDAWLLLNVIVNQRVTSWSHRIDRGPHARTYTVTFELTVQDDAPYLCHATLRNAMSELTAARARERQQVRREIVRTSLEADAAAAQGNNNFVFNSRDLDLNAPGNLELIRRIIQQGTNERIGFGSRILRAPSGREERLDLRGARTPSDVFRDVLFAAPTPDPNHQNLRMEMQKTRGQKDLVKADLPPLPEPIVKPGKRRFITNRARKDDEPKT